MLLCISALHCERTWFVMCGERYIYLSLLSLIGTNSLYVLTPNGNAPSSLMFSSVKLYAMVGVQQITQR